MNTLIAILAIFIVILDATHDEIRHHWSRLFAHWFPSGKDQWWNPAVSWQNKYHKSRFLTIIMSTVLVPFTDFWHLLKALKINSTFIIVLLLLNVHWDIWEWLIALGLLNVVWGIIFEFTMGVYGTLSDKYMK